MARTAPVLIVQHLRSVCKEPSHAGPGSQRSEIAETREIPLDLSWDHDPRVLVHTVVWSEFVAPPLRAERLIAHPTPTHLQAGCVWIEPADDGIVVDFQHGRKGGAPDRGWARRKFTLLAGKWAQIAYNGRFSGEGFWWYEKTVVNVGLFDEISRDLFIGSNPTHRFATFGRLW